MTFTFDRSDFKNESVFENILRVSGASNDEIRRADRANICIDSARVLALWWAECKPADFDEEE